MFLFGNMWPGVSSAMFTLCSPVFRQYDLFTVLRCVQLLIDVRAQVECTWSDASISQSTVSVVSVWSLIWRCLASVCFWLVACLCVSVRCWSSVTYLCLSTCLHSCFVFHSGCVLLLFCNRFTVLMFLMSPPATLVHLGRSFGASLSWPVTSATRWTSALLIFARGKC